MAYVPPTISGRVGDFDSLGHQLCEIHCRNHARLCAGVARWRLEVLAAAKSPGVQAVGNTSDRQSMSHLLQVSRLLNWERKLTNIPVISQLFRFHSSYSVYKGESIIRCTKMSPASLRQVDAFHKLYCDALRELFDKHKASYGMAQASLDLV